MAQTNLGANPVDDGTDDPQTFTYDLFSLKKNAPNLAGRKLQDVYGRGTMPSFQWVEAIKSGQRTYTDSSAADRLKMQQYIEDWKNADDNEKSGYPTPEEIMREIGSTVAPIAMGVGESLATGGTFMEGLPFIDSGGSLATGTTSFNAGALKDFTGAQLDALKAAPSLTGNNAMSTADAVKAIGSPEQIALYEKTGDASFLTDAGATVGRDLSQSASFGELLTPDNPAGLQNWKGAAGGAVGNFGIQLLMGQDPVTAAKSAGAGALGKVIGSALGGPLGGWIGGALGSIIGGRVICNELYNQGLITKRQLVNDYKFTKDYLTPAHVNGYHLWALWMVKKMRKGNYVKFWKHIVLRRSNEIAYIYGERDKPDYLGKVYRRIFEPICWVLGKFCKETDWSVLYNKKEIQHG
tara:strand:+ start:1312 stop:2538 length:1227 start_codon:yes stop_codon:yes gene_type:complete